ncbi:hypothetical protein VOLCADRAFT_93413 [Volvox carteri f. nagariensis]|uniref:Uncharacterized protein n=1 Tax=Volvox carteri f. nagariensis TaxID=3068 RepID=D8U222_VOLCA|nr:uncharacterized protein VOLCADRAFT_93413 [Volvox carteri f. nagariensis]EFJ46206.1 hypothetical protein VOLCADRAFT_93413 [Volvox carteri f. nagariensis]|eukprot:XP_002952653.1 hypothetical protein VOLCADRAFT_93413 [Volvox carteri f. nagariensis]
MDRPGSPRVRQLGSSTTYLHSSSPVLSPRKASLSLGRVGAPERTDVPPRPSLVQEHLERFKASLQDPDFPAGHNARKKVTKAYPSSSVDIEPQLRAMGAISQERKAVDNSSPLGPRQYWENARPAPGGPPPVSGEYLAKLDCGFNGHRGGGTAARIALLSQLGPNGGAHDARSWGRRVPPTSVLWADIAELRGARRLRQYIAERKREGESPLELLTDIADGWEELRHRQRQRQRRSQQMSEASPQLLPAGGNVVTAAAAELGSTGSVECQQQKTQSSPHPVVYVAESDWPTAAAAVAAAAAAAAAGTPGPLSASSSMAALLAPQPSTISTSGSVTRLVDGPAKPAPTSVVLVHFPRRKSADGGCCGGGGAAAASAPPPSSTLLPPRAPLRRASSSQTPATSEVKSSVSLSIPTACRCPGLGAEGSAAAAAVAAGFIPSLERYHTTYTLPSRALTTGADKLSPRTLVSSTRLVEVVEVVQGPRMRSQQRLSDSSGDVNGGGSGSWATATTPQLQRRRHSVADPSSWAARTGANAGSGGGGSGSGDSVRLAAEMSTLSSKMIALGPAFPVAAWASYTDADADVHAENADVDAETDAGASQASSPRLGTLATAERAVRRAQHWKRLAASPAAGTQIGPGAFSHVAAVTEEAAPARTLGLVPALATSASQIVVVASTPAASPPRAPPPPPPGPLQTERMKSRTVAQLEKCWSLNGRAAAAAAAAATTAAAATSTAGSTLSSSLRLPLLGSSSSACSCPSAVSTITTWSGASLTNVSASSSRDVRDAAAGHNQPYGGGGSAAGASTSTSGGAMDVIPESPREGEEDESTSSLGANCAHPHVRDSQPYQLHHQHQQEQQRRLHHHHQHVVSDPGMDTTPPPPPPQQQQQQQRPEILPVLPPRPPPPGALRSRSLNTLSVLTQSGAGPAEEFLDKDCGGGGGGSCRTRMRTGPLSNVRLGLAARRMRTQDLPPAAAGAAAAAAVVASPESSSASFAAGAGTAGSGAVHTRGRLCRGSLRRLLNDQVRVANMVYGSPYDELDGELDETDGHNYVELQDELPQQQRQGGERGEVLQPQPPSQPRAVPHVPATLERQQQQQLLPYQHGDAQGHGDGLRCSHSTVSSVAAAGDAASARTSATDHCADVLSLGGEPRALSSSFLTATTATSSTGSSSIAPSEDDGGSPAPSAEPSGWALAAVPPAPPLAVRISTASIAASSNGDGVVMSATLEATGLAALTSADAAAVAAAEDDEQQRNVEAALLRQQTDAAAAPPPLPPPPSPLPPPAVQNRVVKLKKHVAVAAVGSPRNIGRHHPAAASPRARFREYSLPKRSGGGFLIVTSSATARPAAGKATAATAASGSGGAGGTAVSASAHVEVDVGSLETHKGSWVYEAAAGGPGANVVPGRAVGASDDVTPVGPRASAPDGTTARTAALPDQGYWNPGMGCNIARIWCRW